MTQETFIVLEALCHMWNQYCSGTYGHDFMSAGEDCLDILEDYELIKNATATGGEIDWDKLNEYRINTL